MFTVNDWIATTPFPESGIKTGIRRGVAVIEQATKLTELIVVLPNVETDVKVGDKVYVKGEAFKHQWSGEVFDSDEGVKFILIPKSIIVAVSKSA
jgi:hypothetical protein